MSTILLDSVERLSLDLDVLPVKNLHTMRYLPHGMHLLANTVRAQENEFAARFGPDWQLFFAPGQHDLVANCFGWFSVSLVTYLRLVRLLTLMVERNWDTPDLKAPENRQEIRRLCTSYVRSCAPAVYRWRNKIGAHAAVTDPFDDDSLGTLEASLIIPVHFQSPYFWAGAFNWATRGEQSEFPGWAITKVFEDLAPRLWPHLTLPVLINKPP